MTAPDVVPAREAYERWHGRHEVDSAADTPWHRLLKKYLEWDRDVAGRRVLEIGSGRGGFACWMARQPRPPRELIAADFAATAVLMGRDFATASGGRILWEIGDIQRLPHASATFDTVVSCETIEHCPDPRLALRELARVLKPGGRLLLTTPNYLGPMGLYRIYLRLRGRRFTEEGQPINHALTLPSTVRWTRQAGLTVKAVDATGHYLPLPGAPPRECRWLDGRSLRWFALHSLVVAAKPTR
jgi:2-polyprenyl-3-methyl-5-hydroxy-6-metoxy-1,4-benzoquinol methylase